MSLFGPDHTYAAIRRRFVPGTVPEAAPAPAPVADAAGFRALRHRLGPQTRLPRGYDTTGRAGYWP